MKVDLENLWLCQDCVQAAVNGDFTGLDYSYEEDEAEDRMREIESGLETLGPNLVIDFDENNTWHQCDDCNHRFIDEAESTACHECGSEDVSVREPGYLKFSWIECDCCGSDLGGSRYRFATLTDDN